MAQHTGLVNSWDLPNFVGPLFTADYVPGESINPSFLTLVGGLNGNGGRLVPAFDFRLSLDYDYRAVAQPDISETDSQTLPDPVAPVYTTDDNTVQIYQEAVELTYKTMATTGRLVTDHINGGGTEGYMSEFSPNNFENLKNKMIAYALQNVHRDVNHTFLNGTYQRSTGKTVAARTRGILTAISTNAIAAGTADLSRTLMNQLFREMATNSSSQAYSWMPVIFVNAFQKQQLSEIYAFPPMSRNVGGYNIQVIETDFASVGIVYEPTIPTDTVLFASMSMCQPVFNEVPGKGVLFYEEKEKTAASEGGMIYGHIGLDYGPEWAHGKITGLSTS